MTTLVYIMGRGHSGSTILDILLGSASDACGVGELIPGLERFESGICSCTESINRCVFWSQVKLDFETSGASWNELSRLTRQANLSQFLKTMFISRRKREQLRELNGTLFDIIAKRCDAKFVVDSSKELTRALFLAKTQDAKIIHIIRSPFDIIESNLHRIESGHPFRFLRRNYTNKNLKFLFISLSALGWNVGFVLAILVSWFARKNYIRVYYNDLYERPEWTLKRLGLFLGLDLNEVIDRVNSNQPIPIIHRISGNQIRFNKEVVFRKSRDKKGLGFFQKLVVYVLTFPTFLALRSKLIA